MPPIEENQWGKIQSSGTLQYSNLTSCMTVTCICKDGTLAGGHAVLTPYAFAYVVSQVGKLVKGKTVKHICLIGVDTWKKLDNLQDIYDHLSEHTWKSNPLNLEEEKLYLRYLIKDGIQAAVKAILTASGATSYYILDELNGNSNQVQFIGNANKTVSIQVDGVTKKTLRYG